jgi:hypothetical protein
MLGPANEERITADEKRAGLQLDEGRFPPPSKARASTRILDPLGNLTGMNVEALAIFLLPYRTD